MADILEVELTATYSFLPTQKSQTHRVSHPPQSVPPLPAGLLLLLLQQQVPLLWLVSGAHALIAVSGEVV